MKLICAMSYLMARMLDKYLTRSNQIIEKSKLWSMKKQNFQIEATQIVSH